MARIARLLLMFGMLLFAVPSGAFAASCSCWCETTDGAVKLDAPQADRGACSDACRASSTERSKAGFLGCFDMGQSTYTPEQSKLCWTQARCEADTVMVNGVEKPSVWGGQEGSCMPGKGYCYAPPGDRGGNEVDLSVAIGNMTRSGNIATYIVNLYMVFLAIGAILAVLILMAAGLLWLTSGGSAGQIGRAKDMIQNAIVGLVLLFAAWTIGNFIDPRLTSFTLFEAPKLQPVLYMENDCIALKDAGYTISPDPTSGSTSADQLTCGKTGTVTGTDGVENAVIGVDVGFECQFIGCPGLMDTCTSVGSGWQCVRCAEVHGSNVAGMDPSEGLCESLVPYRQAQLIQDRIDAPGEIVRCEYYDAPEASPSSLIYGDACLEIRYSGTEGSATVGSVQIGDAGSKYTPHIDCDALRRRAPSGQANCALYQHVYGQGYGRRSSPGSDLTPNMWNVLDFPDSQGNYSVLDSVCSDDPCGFAPPDSSCDLLNAADYAESSYAEELCRNAGIGSIFGDWDWSPCSIYSVDSSPFSDDFPVACVPGDYKAAVDQFMSDPNATGVNTPFRDEDGDPIGTN